MQSQNVTPSGRAGQTRFVIRTNPGNTLAQSSTSGVSLGPTKYIVKPGGTTQHTQYSTSTGGVSGAQHTQYTTSIGGVSGQQTQYSSLGGATSQTTYHSLAGSTSQHRYNARQSVSILRNNKPGLL